MICVTRGFASIVSVSLQSFFWIRKNTCIIYRWIANISFTSSGDVFYYFTVSLIHLRFYLFAIFTNHIFIIWYVFAAIFSRSFGLVADAATDMSTTMPPNFVPVIGIIRLKMWVGVGLELIFNFFWIRRRNGSEASWPARISGLSRRQRADLHVSQFKGDGRDLARRRWITRGANRNAR